MIPVTKKFFLECHVAGRQYHDASEVWDKLKMGTQLFLDREENNHVDSNAIAIGYRDPETEELFKLGYIPKCHNELIASFLDMCWNKIFDVRISKIDPNTHYENQLRVVIKIKKNEEL